MTELFINKQPVDLGEKDFSTKFNRSYLDLQNLDSKSGDWSYSTKLIKSKQNNLIFSNIQNFQGSDKFVRTENYTYSYIQDGVLTSSGIVKLNSVDEKFYNVNFLSNNISWSKLLSGKNLNNIQNRDGSPWTIPFRGSGERTHVYTMQWYIDNPDYNNEVAFPLISYGNFFSDNNWIPYDGIPSYNLSYRQIPPTPYELKVAERIFDGIGWSVDGDIFNDPEQRKVILPFTTTDYYAYTYERSNTSGSTQLFFTDNLTPLTDPNNFEGIDTVHSRRGLFTYVGNRGYKHDPYFNVHYIPTTDLAGKPATETLFIAPTADTYSVDITLNSCNFDFWGVYDSYHLFDTTVDFYDHKAGFMLVVDPGDTTIMEEIFQQTTDYLWDVGAGNYTGITHENVLFYYDIIGASSPYPYYFTPSKYQPDITYSHSNSGVTFSGPGQPTGFGDYYHVLTNPSLSFQIRNLNLELNESLKLFFVYQGYTAGQPHDVIYTQMTINYTEWNIWGKYSGDTSLNVSQNLSDSISQLEWLKTWAAKSNLYYIADQENKVVRFDTYDNFFLPTAHAYDITNKIDDNLHEPESRPVEMPSVLRLKYNNDTDDVLLAADPSYATIESVNDNVFASPEKEIRLLYSSTKLREFKIYEMLYSSPLFINLPSIANDDAVNNYDLTTVDWSFSSTMRVLKLTNFFTNATGGTYTVYIDGYQSQIQLSTFASDPYLSLDFNGTNGLYQRFYARALQEFGDSHIITLPSTISAYDFSQLQPNVPVLINGLYFTLYSIKNFDPAGGKCVIELLKKFTN